MFRSDSVVDEEKIINEAAGMLSTLGEVKIESITDNINPHSASRVPDLVFIPESGPNKDVVHIIEFKTTTSEILPSVMVFNALLYKRRIQDANPGVEVRYALSSNGRVIVDDAEAGDVTPLATVRDAQDLAEKIAEWSGVREAKEVLAAANAPVEV
jgi:hypothetical protein